MLIRLGKFAVVLSLICLVDGHLGSLQCVAWINMLKDRSADAESIPQLVVETISGAKPCDLCLSIQEHSKDEDQPANDQLTVKPVKLISHSAPPMILTPPLPSTKEIDPGSFGRTRGHPPLTMPPRSLA